MNADEIAKTGLRAAAPALQPIVFLGPSMSRGEARSILEADFRPPCRRGDVADAPDGALVGLIDGVFHQDEAVSPRELVSALERGVTIFGSSSMGALRAVEVPGVIGVGRVFEMYKTGLINSDDEVALVFNPDDCRPLTVPLVNVRHAVDRLVRAGTIERFIGERLVAAAKRLHYRERIYSRILVEADLHGKADARDLAALLDGFDLKRDDARLLLERLVQYARKSGPPAAPPPCRSETDADYRPPDEFGVVRASRVPADAPVSIWEIGGEVPFGDLVRFLKLTGDFDGYARRALFRFLGSGGTLKAADGVGDATVADVQGQLFRLFRAWGWNTHEEVHVTLRDLGIGFKDLLGRAAEEVRARRTVAIVARNPPELFQKALRAELAFDDLALKRAAMRYRSLLMLSDAGPQGPPSRTELDAARKVMCRVHGGASFRELSDRLEEIGVPAEDVDAFLHTLVSARRAAGTSSVAQVCPPPDALRRADARFGLNASPKAPDEPRFSCSLRTAYEHALRLKDLIGVTRVAMVSRLGDLPGVFVSQAARPDGVWSSSYGSGKSSTEEGAIVGAIMEETEKWAQERFTGEPRWTTYAALRSQERTLNPTLLDLPHDSPYHEDLEIAWHRCHDLIQSDDIYVPLASVSCSFHAGRNNIYYSERGARVVFSTNGLASGFTPAEALVHGVCEYVERHAARMAELRVDNPGLPDRRRWPRRIAADSLPGFLRELVEAFLLAGCEVGIWDITSEVRVPTVYARLLKDQELSRGWASHPNAAVAVHMALLEAAQTMIAAIAGGREDLTVKARSLGRHERANPLRGGALAFWDDADAPLVDLGCVEGFVSSDAYAELAWVRQRLIAAGVAHLIAVDLTRAEIAPACAFRVILPGLETNTPFYTGPRARMALLEDLLPPAPDTAHRMREAER